MKCYYYIKLPNGGELKIPANFSTLSNDDKDLRNLINNFKKGKNDAFNILQSYVKNNTGLSGQATVLIKKIPIDEVDINDIDFNNFIQSINTAVIEKGDYVDLRKALATAIFSKKGKLEYLNTNENLRTANPKEVIEKLKKPIHIDYFDQVDFENIISAVSYNDLHKENIIKILELESFNLNANLPKNLNELLKFAFPNKNYNRTKKTFFKTSFSSDSAMGKDDSVIVYDDNLEMPFIFVQENSQISLHFAVFKVIAVSLFQNNPAYLKEVIENFNKKAHEKNQINPDITVKEFFTGKVVENERTDPEFYKLYKFAYGEDALNLLLDKMIELLPEEERKTLKNPLKTIVGLMSPKNLSSFNKLKEHKEFVKNSSMEQVGLIEKHQIKNILPLFEKDKRTSHYNIPETVGPFESSVELFNFLNYDLRRGIDLIRVELENKKSGEIRNKYITPTTVKILDGVVFVRGWYSQNGTPTEYSGVLNHKNPLVINRFYSTKSPDIYSSNVTEKLQNPIIIKIDPNDRMPDDVVKSLIHRGSYVEYTYETFDKKTQSTKIEKGKGRVKNVLPGEIKLNPINFKTGATSISPRMSSITMIHSNIEELGGFIHERLSKIKDLSANQEEDLNSFLIGRSLDVIKNLKKWDNTAPITKGDWVGVLTGEKTKSGEDAIIYNMVVGRSTNSVYILIQTAKGTRIELLPKEKIKFVYKPEVRFDNSKRKELEKLYSAVTNGRSIRQSNYSMFYDPNKLSDGDFAWSSSKSTLYQLLNKEHNEFINFSIKNGEESVEYTTTLPADVVYFTEKNIADSSYPIYIDFNNFDLITTDELEPGQIEKRYLIPKNMDLTIENVLPSGNLNMGLVKEVDFVQDLNEDPTEYIDVTKELIELINLKRKDSSESKGTKMLAIKNSERGFYKRYDSNLYQVPYSKDYFEFLKEFAFISLKTKVVENGVEKENISHKYKIVANTGKDLILEYNVFNKFGKVITVSKILNLKKEADSIKYLYVMKNNSNYAAIKKINEASKQQEGKVPKQKMFSNIISAFQNLYNIDVEVRVLEEGLKNTKKAYIQTSSGGNKIVINRDLKNSEDEIVHEYLHLFLAGARYNNPGLYETLLVNWLKAKNKPLENINLIEAEELFVTEVSGLMVKNAGDLATIDMDSFLTLFNEILIQLGVIEEWDKTFTPENGSIESVFNILYLKMSDIPAFNSLKSSKSRSNLLYYDSNFKSWIEKLTNNKDENNKLTINCK